MASIQGVYVALFGRPADPAGLAHFNQVTSNGANLDAVGDLSATAEFQSRFADMSRSEIINAIYQSLFERDADPDGLAFFLAAWEAGTYSINTIAIAILDGAQGTDRQIIDAKIAAADIFNERLDTSVEVAAYAGTDAADIGRLFLQQVDPDQPGTAPLADYYISLLVSQGGQGPGSDGGSGGSSDRTAPIGTVGGSNGPYSDGDTISIKVSFDEVVISPSGTLALTGDRVATLIRGSGTDELVFEYTVRPDEYASDIDILGISGVADAAGNAASLDGLPVQFDGMIFPRPPEGEVHVYDDDGALFGVYSTMPKPSDYEGLNWKQTDFPINDAVAASDNNFTVMVGPGEYETSGTISITKTGLTLRGAFGNTDTDPLTLAGLAEGEEPPFGVDEVSAVFSGDFDLISVEADDVEINGFAFIDQSCGCTTRDILTTEAGASNSGLTVKSNVIFGSTGNGLSILDHGDVLVSNNLILGTGGDGIFLRDSDAEIENNLILLTYGYAVNAEDIGLANVVSISGNLVFSNNMDPSGTVGPFLAQGLEPEFTENSIYGGPGPKSIKGTKGDDIFLVGDGAMGEQDLVLQFDVAMDKISLLGVDRSFADLDTNDDNALDADDDDFDLIDLGGGRNALVYVSDLLPPEDYTFALVGITSLAATNYIAWSDLV